MIINDNDKEYDTEEIEEYPSYTQGLIKCLIYIRYVGVRDLLSDNRYSKHRVNQVGGMLNKGSNVERIKNVFGYSIEEINCHVGFTEAFIPAVR